MCNTNPDYLLENTPAPDEAVLELSMHLMDENVEAYEVLAQ